MDPKYVHILISGPVTVTLFVKRDFANVVTVQVLRWGDYPRYLMRAQYRRNVLHQNNAGGARVRGGGEVMTELRLKQCSLEMEKGATNQRI